MKSKEELQQKLIEDIGTNEIPLVRTRNISEISLEQLQELLLENDLVLEGSREQKETKLMTKLGSWDVDIVEMVQIDTLNVIELEEILNKIIRHPGQDETNNTNVKGANLQEENNNVEANESESQEPARKTIREVQQELASNCGFGNEIIWDLLPENDANIMKNKIKQLIPDQKEGQKSIEKLRENIFENVWAQRKYTNRTSVTYLFYIMVTKETDFNKVLDSTEYSCHPVFRCKKCDKNSDTSDCCMIYVDETGRVYQNWKSFIEENILPAGIMVAPRKGVYNFNRNNEVILDIYCTPNGTTGAKVMSAAQTGSAVVGIGAACVPIAALALPVAAPVMAAAGIIGLGVGAFTSITSALNLTDRKKHEQSISITNSQARASYLGVAGGIVGMAAAGATKVMTSMAAAGKATVGLELLVNGINVTSIVLSGSGVANGVLDLLFKYNDGDKITSLDVLQLSASLVLFTHSVYNFQLASQIANEARINSIRAYRDTLSNRQRKMFDKMSKETIRIRGSTQGKMDIIRGVNEIPDRQYLNDLFNINKQLNQRNVRPAFGKSGEGIVLNNELHIDTGTLRQSVQHQQGPNLLDQVTRPIPSTHNTDTYTTQTPKAVRLLYSTGKVELNIDANHDILNDINKQTNNNSIAKLYNLALSLPSGVILLLRDYGEKFLNNIADGYKFQDVILSMAENFPEDTFRFLINLAQYFIENELEKIKQTIKIYIPTESILYRILIQVLDNYSNFSYDFISRKRPEILLFLKKFYLTFNSNNARNLTKICPECNGRLYVCM